MTRDKSSERNAYAAFKMVRNRLRKYHPEEIILACVAKLNEKPADWVQHARQFPPWNLLLLVKWTLLYGDFLSPGRRHVSDAEFHTLLNLMHDFSGCVRLPSDYEHHRLFLRNVAFQQFWFQHLFRGASFARQSLIFDRVPDTHDFRRLFVDRTGISIRHYIELAFALLTRFLTTNESFVDTHWFSTVGRHYPENTVDLFLEMMSGDINSLRGRMPDARKEGRSILYEYYERTPLLRIPLVKLGNRYYPFSREVLFRAVENFIYDTLRAEDPETFMQKFGPLFEKYVGRTLAYMDQGVITEKQLTQALPEQGKVVDFVIVDEDTNVLIDAKGVEMHYLGMIGHRPEIIRDKTKSSVISGIRQGFETAVRMREVGKIDGLKVGNRENYLIIVTFKDLYLGTGLDFFESIAKETLQALVKEYGGSAPIPFANMYFVPIEDLDLYAECVKQKGVGLVEGLEKAKAADAKAETKKFTFDQHVMSWCPEVGPTDYLSREYDTVGSRLEKLITQE